MNSTNAVVMFDYLVKEGCKFNEAEQKFMDSIKAMKPLRSLSSKQAEWVRSIYERKTRNLSGAIV
jgi:hypothetical protein